MASGAKYQIGGRMWQLTSRTIILCIACITTSMFVQIILGNAFLADYAKSVLASPTTQATVTCFGSECWATCLTKHIRGATMGARTAHMNHKPERFVVAKRACFGLAPFDQTAATTSHVTIKGRRACQTPQRKLSAARTPSAADIPAVNAP